jgi:hypothetical protein
VGERVHDEQADQDRADPEFLTALAAAHTGRWPLADALWWQHHPEEPGPSGRPAPLRRLRELQHRVFSAQGDAAGDASAAQAVRELAAEIEAERSALTAALGAARRHLEGRTAAALDGTGRPGPAPVGATIPAATPTGPSNPVDPGDPDAAPDPAIERSAHRPARRRALLAGALVLVVVAAGAAGAVLGSGLTVAGADVAAVPSASATPAAAGLNVAATFVPEQRPEDIPAVTVAASFQPESFRYLGSLGWAEDPNAVGSSPYYAARAGSRVCLVAVPDGGGYLATCVAEAAFPTEGLRLSWESADPVGPVGTEFYAVDEAARALSDVTVVWGSPDGMTSEWSGRTAIGP